MLKRLQAAQVTTVTITIKAASRSWVLRAGPLAGGTPRGRADLPVPPAAWASTEPGGGCNRAPLAECCIPSVYRRAAAQWSGTTGAIQHRQRLNPHGRTDRKNQPIDWGNRAPVGSVSWASPNQQPPSPQRAALSAK